MYDKNILKIVEVDVGSGSDQVIEEKKSDIEK